MMWLDATSKQVLHQYKSMFFSFYISNLEERTCSL